ncbi:MAG: transcription elongation factor GreA [Rhizobiaceae bacterium]|nr:transcription elongation factor GreA [Rhizobiaceae bacterium]
MSVAFVREPNEHQSVESLPDREIGTDPNFVTQRGLELIEAELVTLHAALDAAQAADDKNAVATISRDLRYWTARSVTAEVVETPPSDEVHFGHRVTIERDDGRRQVFQIVGQDEADPAKGLLSYVAPLAKSLAGKRVGDVVTAGPGDAEIVAIDA